jgi:hypothetical protein
MFDESPDETGRKIKRNKMFCSKGWRSDSMGFQIGDSRFGIPIFGIPWNLELK